RNGVKARRRERGKIFPEDVNRASPAGDENYRRVRLLAGFDCANTKPRSKLEVARSKIGTSRRKHFGGWNSSSQQPSHRLQLNELDLAADQLSDEPYAECHIRECRCGTSQ